MRPARTILIMQLSNSRVNTDPNAAIFKVADYGMTADLRAVLENYLKL